MLMDKRERQLLVLCREFGLGYRLSRRGGHYAVVDPVSGRTVATASVSTGDRRSILNLRASLRRYRASNA